MNSIIPGGRKGKAPSLGLKSGMRGIRTRSAGVDIQPGPVEPYLLLRQIQAGDRLLAVEYLTRVRLERAIALLKDTSRTITKVSLSVGFGDSSYSLRVFRSREGTFPRSRRKSRPKLERRTIPCPSSDSDPGILVSESDPRVLRLGLPLRDGTGCRVARECPLPVGGQSRAGGRYPNPGKSQNSGHSVGNAYATYQNAPMNPVMPEPQSVNTKSATARSSLRHVISAPPPAAISLPE